MEKAAAEARKQYMKQWRAKNQEKIKQYQIRYWEKKVNQLKKEASGEEMRQG